jgi:hypothetical protein
MGVKFGPDPRLVELAIGIGSSGRGIISMAGYAARREAEVKARVEARQRPRLARMAERMRQFDQQFGQAGPNGAA